MYEQKDSTQIRTPELNLKFTRSKVTRTHTHTHKTQI